MPTRHCHFLIIQKTHGTNYYFIIRTLFSLYIKANSLFKNYYIIVHQLNTMPKLNWDNQLDREIYQNSDLKALHDNDNDPVIITNINDIIIYANKKACELIWKEESEILNIDINEIHFTQKTIFWKNYVCIGKDQNGNWNHNNTLTISKTWAILDSNWEVCTPINVKEIQTTIKERFFNVLTIVSINNEVKVVDKAREHEQLNMELMIKLWDTVWNLELTQENLVSVLNTMAAPVRTVRYVDINTPEAEKIITEQNISWYALEYYKQLWRISLIDWVNDAMLKLLWRSKDEIIGLHIFSELIINEKNAEIVFNSIKSRINNELENQTSVYQIELLNSKWELVNVEITAIDKIFKGEMRTITTIIDINELTAFIEKLKEKVNNDSLTWLFNRRYFDEALERSINYANRMKCPLSLIIFDLDHFKQVNDQCWHTEGDRVLRIVWEMIRKRVLRWREAACRYWWEEFAIILHVTQEEAAEIAEIIRKDIDEYDFWLENWQNVTASFWIARLNQYVNKKVEKDSSEAFITRADNALYSSKTSWRNKVTISKENLQF